MKWTCDGQLFKTNWNPAGGSIVLGKLQFNPIKVFPEVLRTTEANKINFIGDMTDLLVGFDLNECML